MKGTMKQEVKWTHPTWAEVLPIIVSVIEDQEAGSNAKDWAMKLLERMARTADEWNSPE